MFIERSRNIVIPDFFIVQSVNYVLNNMLFSLFMQSNCPSKEKFTLIKFGDALILFIVSFMKSNLCLLFIDFKVKTGWLILKKDKLLAFLLVVPVIGIINCSSEEQFTLILCNA